MQNKKTLVGICAFALACLFSSTIAANADTILYVDDSTGNIGQVDITTQSVVAGSVHATGQVLTDIGFTSSGTLYGTTFTGLYSVNPGTGALTSQGSYGSVTSMNGLVGDGSNLLGSANATTTIYSINPSNPSALSTYGTSNGASAGDLAFAGSSLYESTVGAGGADALYNVTSGTSVGIFRVGSTGGPTVSGLFGLANDGTTTYGVNGTQVYSVDLTNAVLTPLFSYGGNAQGLGSAYGSAFINEGPTPAPEPSSLALFATGLLGLGLYLSYRRRHKA